MASSFRSYQLKNHFLLVTKWYILDRDRFPVSCNLKMAFYRFPVDLLFSVSCSYLFIYFFFFAFSPFFATFLGLTPPHVIVSMFLPFRLWKTHMLPGRLQAGAGSKREKVLPQTSTQYPTGSCRHRGLADLSTAPGKQINTQNNTSMLLVTCLWNSYIIYIE